MFLWYLHRLPGAIKGVCGINILNKYLLTSATKCTFALSRCWRDALSEYGGRGGRGNFSPTCESQQNGVPTAVCVLQSWGVIKIWNQAIIGSAYLTLATITRKKELLTKRIEELSSQGCCCGGNRRKDY